MSALRLLPLVLSLTAGCAAPPNSLEGSLGALVNLTFQKEEVQVSSSILLIQYQYTPGGGGLEIPFQLEMTPPAGAALAEGTVLDLTGLKPDGTPIVSCTRAFTNDPRTELPPIKNGKLTLTSNFAIGAVASGTFDILFGEGGDVGEGTTLNGTFSTVAVAPTNQGSNP